MIKLTKTVSKGGCAAKVPALVLREILSGVKFPPKIPGVIVDGSHFDDAAIYEINDSTSLVQTLDFFTPIVDSPKNFGAIAAANALSDVYAMGGRPATCMAILAAPLATLDQSVIQEILQGACDTIAQSGSSLVGGHSIDDETLKFGLSVTGLVHPQFVWSNQTAKVGDGLILTKPLGTGTLCAGLKREVYNEESLSEMIDSMKRLNNIIDFLSEEERKSIHAATDITGFGLAGHAYQLSLASQVSLSFDHQKIPLFAQTRNSLEQGLLTKAHRTNNEYTKNKLNFSHNISEIDKLIYFDPQTSGGLLLSVESKMISQIINKLAKVFPGISQVGRVCQRSEFNLYAE